MGDLDPGRGIEQRATEMGGRTHAGRAVLQLRGVRLRIGDELLQVVGWKILAREQHHRLLGEQRDRREIGRRAVRELLVKRLVVGVGADAAEQEHVAVGRRFCHAVGADDAGGGADVLHDHLLAQALAELRREDSRHDIERVAGGERYHHGHRPSRPVLRLSGRA